MPDNSNPYLTEQEISNLDVLTQHQIGDMMIYRYGLLYDKSTREVIAKVKDFEHSKKRFLRILPVETDTESFDYEFSFKPMTWQELSSQEFGEEQWMVRGLIPIQGLVIISAPSGEKKTWFALELVKSISRGTHFLAHDEFITRRNKVLYIDAEMGPKQLQRRCRLLDFDSIPADNTPEFLTGIEINLREAEGFDSLVNYVEQNSINVVVIDTLRAVAGQLEEDNAAAVREFYQRFNRLKNNGKVVIILDHNRKPDQKGHGVPKKEQVLGSQDKIANAEVVLMIKGDFNPSYFTVHQVKNRTGIETKPFNVGIRDIPSNVGGMDVVSVEMNYEGELDEQTSKMDEAKLVIPQIVGNDFMLTGEIVKVLAKNHDIAERYCREALREMTESGVLEQSKKGRSYIFRVAASNLFDQPRAPD